MTKKDGKPTVALTKFEFGFRLIPVPKMCLNCDHRGGERLPYRWLAEEVPSLNS